MRGVPAVSLFLACLWSVGSAQARTSDEITIKELIARHGRASEHRDLRGLVDLYHPDAEIVYSNGARIVGRTAIEDAYRQSLESAAGVSGRHHTHPPESVRIRFVRPDLALVEVESHSVGGRDGQGVALPTSKSLLITLWIRHDGQWTIFYQRSTPIPER